MSEAVLGPVNQQIVAQQIPKGVNVEPYHRRMNNLVFGERSTKKDVVVDPKQLNFLPNSPGVERVGEPVEFLNYSYGLYRKDNQLYSIIINHKPKQGENPVVSAMRLDMTPGELQQNLAKIRKNLKELSDTPLWELMPMLLNNNPGEPQTPTGIATIEAELAFD